MQASNSSSWAASPECCTVLRWSPAISTSVSFSTPRTWLVFGRSFATCGRDRFSSPKLSFLDNSEPGVALNILYLETELGPIDLLGSVKGVGDSEHVHA